MVSFFIMPYRYCTITATTSIPALADCPLATVLFIGALEAHLLSYLFTYLLILCSLGYQFTPATYMNYHDIISGGCETVLRNQQHQSTVRQSFVTEYVL